MTSSPQKPDAPPPAGAYDVPVPPDSPTSFSTLSAPGATATAEHHDAGERSVGGAWVVGLGIAAAIVVSFAAIVLLYYKWYKTDEYQTTIIVWGEAVWDGDTVTVSGSGLPT